MTSHPHPVGAAAGSLLSTSGFRVLDDEDDDDDPMLLREHGSAIDTWR